MNLKKKDETGSSFYTAIAGLILFMLAGIVALLFACIPMAIIWFVLVGILEYDISVRVVYWIVYGFTLILVIIMAVED